MSELYVLHERVVRQFYEGRPDEHRAFAVKAAEEAAELAADPDDLTECADVLICILGYLHARGYTWEHLLAAADQKMTINEARIWGRRPDGTWKHVKEAP